MFDDNAFGGTKPKASKDAKAIFAMTIFIIALLFSGGSIVIAFGSHSRFMADEALKKHPAFAYAQVRSVTSVAGKRPTDKIGFMFPIKATSEGKAFAYGSDFIPDYDAAGIRIGQNVRVMYDADDPSIVRLDYEGNLPSREQQNDPFTFWIGAAIMESALLSIFTLIVLKRA